MPWASTYGDVEVGGTILHGMVSGAAREVGDRPALVDGPTGHVVTYGTLTSRMERVAAGLAERGFVPGDVLALWAPDEPR